MICKFCKNTFQIENIHNPYQIYCSKRCNRNASRYKHRERLNREALARYYESRAKLIFPTSICKYCGKSVKSLTLKPRIFCSNKCLKDNWMKTHREYMTKACKEWRYNNLDRSRALGRKNQSERYKRCRESVIHNATNQNAKRRGAIGSHTFKEWNEVKQRFHFSCVHCGEREPFENQRYKYLTVDHIIPLKKGGTNYISNIQPSCFSCNSSKGARLNYQRTLLTS